MQKFRTFHRTWPFLLMEAQNSLLYVQQKELFSFAFMRTSPPSRIDTRDRHTDASNYCPGLSDTGALLPSNTVHCCRQQQREGGTAFMLYVTKLSQNQRSLTATTLQNLPARIPPQTTREASTSHARNQSTCAVNIPVALPL